MKNQNVMKTWAVAMSVLPFVGLGFPACQEQAEQLQKQEQIKEKVYDQVDQMPEYPGGFQKLVQFMTQNMNYPESAKDRGTEGTVYVSFVVDKDGNVTQAEVKKGVTTELDEEALRVVNSMPAWNAGKQDGKTVNVKMVLPVKFALN